MMHKPTFVVIAAVFSAILLARAGSVDAVLPTDYTEIIILEPPSNPSPHCVALSGQDCVLDGSPVPVVIAGIDDAGNAFGTVETNHPHLHHFEEAARWLRRDGYIGENVGKYVFDPKFEGGFGGVLPDNRVYGVKPKWVNPSGYADGCSNVNNCYMYRYDIVQDMWWDFGPGVGEKGNANGRVIATEVSQDVRIGRYARVSDSSLIEPQLGEAEAGQFNGEMGEIQRLEGGAQPRAINDFEVIIGNTTEGNAIRIMPLDELTEEGFPQWGPQENLPELGPAFLPSFAVDISNTEPAFAIGNSQSFAGIQGVVWNVHENTVAAEFPAFHIPNRINSTGNMAVGTRRASVFDPAEAVIFWTENEWEDWQMLAVQDIMDVVPGGEHFAEISIPAGSPPEAPSPQAVNKHGELLLVGKLKPEAPIEKLTNWTRDLATGERCVSNGPCGIPFILETRPYIVDLKGDVNFDAALNNLDVTALIRALGVGGAIDDPATLRQFHTLVRDGRFPNADMDGDLVVSNLDITVFVNALSAVSTAAAVPEPVSLVVLLLGGAAVLRRRRAAM